VCSFLFFGYEFWSLFFCILSIHLEFSHHQPKTQNSIFTNRESWTLWILQWCASKSWVWRS
jgi:hypothetical protein